MQKGKVLWAVFYAAICGVILLSHIIAYCVHKNLRLSLALNHAFYVLIVLFTWKLQL